MKHSLLKEKIRESLSSVLPITAIVLALCFSVAPIPAGVLLAFIVGALLLIAGMGLFTLGTETAMTPLGQSTGAAVTKSRKLWLIIAVSLLLGIIVTVSEPDLQVLASQVPSVPNLVLIGAVALGVGLFLVAAMLRTVFGVKLRYMLIGCYIVVFALAAFVPDGFLSIAFDSGGVTTGPMTVPFIMALGVGVSSIRSDKNAASDSFGLVALCSVGPILAVMLLGLIYKPSETSYVSAAVLEASDSRELWSYFSDAFPRYFKEVAVALAPIILFFAVFQVISLRMKKKELIRVLIGLGYTYAGLVLFLTGANAGFMPAGNYLGRVIAGLDFNWIIIPVGMLLGFFIVMAEPAVYVLKEQVEQITDGAIPRAAMTASLSVGVAVSVGLAMLRVLSGLHIMWLLIPGYALSILLSFISPEIFTAIAFDSGGVASGPMTATFLLPFAIGVCETVGGNIITDAFGVVAMVAMTPLITIQALGVAYRIKSKRAEAASKAAQTAEDDIIEL